MKVLDLLDVVEERVVQAQPALHAGLVYCLGDLFCLGRGLAKGLFAQNVRPAACHGHADSKWHPHHIDFPAASRQSASLVGAGPEATRGPLPMTNRERIIKTLKYEWLKHVAIVKGFDHLVLLCSEFQSWYNNWRPHMTLNGQRPDDVYYGREFAKPNRDSKTVPCRIERHVFQETRITGYRLKNAA